MLVGIDAPLGAPRSLLAATHAATSESPPTATFIQWVAQGGALWPDFFTRAVEAQPWSPLRPFSRVVAGRGRAQQPLPRGMKARGVDPLRYRRYRDRGEVAVHPVRHPGIGRLVGGRPLAGAVASVLADSTLRCGPSTATEPDAGEPGIVLTEIYPRAMYALALAPELPAQRARLRVDKSDRGVASWRRRRVSSTRSGCGRDSAWRFEDADPDMLTEDAFDALLSAAGAAALRARGNAARLLRGADPFEGGDRGAGQPEPLVAGAHVPGAARGRRRGGSRRSKRTGRLSWSGPSREWIASNDLAFAIPDGFPVLAGAHARGDEARRGDWFAARRTSRMAILELIDEVKRGSTPQARPDGYNIGWNAGVAAGQTVTHLHVHVIPRYAGDVPDPAGGIRNVVRGQDPRPAR